MKPKVFRSLQVILMVFALMLMMVGQPAIAQTHPSHHSLLNDYTVALGTATAKTQKSNYAPNEQIIVDYSGFPGNARDWITITPATRPDNSYGQYFYTQGKQNGTYTFNGLPAGDYQVRGYFNWSAGGYNVQTRSNFTVGGTAVTPPTTEPDVCLEGVQATLIDFNTAEPLNGAVNPISSGGVTVSFEGLNVLEVGTSQGGFGGQAGPNQVIASDQANFNGRFLTEPGGRGAYRPTNYRRAITFSQPVNHLCLYMADVDSGQGINVKVSNAKGESLYSKAFPSSTGAEAALTKLDLSQLEGIKTIEMIGDDPIGIDNLIFASIETKPEPTPEPTTPDCSQDNLIKNGSFELGQNPGSWFLRLGQDSTAITDWSISAADVDYLGTTWQPSQGSRSIDLDGEIGSAGGLQQTFNTVPGQTYQVTFDLAGNPDSGPTQKLMKVSAAGDSAEFTFDITGKSRRNMGWENKTWTFTATEPTTTLTFLSQDNSGYGPALDNVAVISTCAAITPEPNPCDPNQPIPGAFSSIRIGDFDGFGFGDGKGLKSASSEAINVDGTGFLSTGDFLPDFNGDGKFSNRDGGDPFDNRSEAEVTGTSLTGDGYEDIGSTGSDYTDVFLGKAFAYQGSPTYGHSFPDGDPTTLPNTPGFKFRFKVAKEKLPQGTPLFLNVVLGDFDVEPVRVILKTGEGQTFSKEVTASAKGTKDGMIQASYLPLDFDQVFSDGDTSGEAGYWVGYLDVDFDAPEEPTLAFDFAEIGTKQIPLTPCSGESPSVEGNIINIDSTQNLSPETATKITLPAGTYTLHVIGQADGGNYDAWTRTELIDGCDGNGENCTKGWEHKYFYQLGNTDSVKVDRTDRYSTASAALANPPADVSFTLTEDTEVQFYVVDGGDPTNNQGGVSLQVISQS